jgi:SET and MYND domain-containing protein
MSGVTASHLADLLRKEQYNSYGILAPLVAPAAAVGSAGPGQQQPAAFGGGEVDEEGERELRGGALYGLASLINHECNPNVARFEYFDRAGSGTSTHIIFKAMHDLPPGGCVCGRGGEGDGPLQTKQTHLCSVIDAGILCTCECQCSCTLFMHD